jgi:predicted regulator of Ras-like GTPase activity (Roadblock/LC7/MglB family)
LRKIVEDLIRIDGVIGSLLVGKDGLVVSSTLLEDEDAEVLGAMSAAMFGTISKSAERIGVGTLRDTIIEASEGSIQLIEAEDLILVVITEKGVNLGMIRIEMRKAAKRVRAEIPM